MVQIYTDELGVSHEFPDDATPQEIDMATRPKSKSAATISQDTLKPDNSTFVDKAKQAISPMVAVGKDVIKQYGEGAKETSNEVRNMLVGDKSSIKPEEPKTFLGGIARTAGEWTAPLPEFAMIPGLGKATELTSKGLADIGKSTKSFNIMSNFVDKVANNASSGTKKTISTIMSKLTGASEDATTRLLERGNKAWKKEYTTPGAISAANRTKATEGLKNAFNAVGDQFEKEVTPFLTSAQGKINTIPARNSMTSKLLDKDMVALDKKGNFVAGPALTKENLSNGIIKALNSIKNVVNSAGENISFLDAHRLRQRVDNIIFNSDIAEVSPIKDAVMDLRSKIVEGMPDKYKEINLKFSSLFDVRDSLKLATKLDPARVESTLLNLQGKAKTAINEGLQKMDDLLPESKKFYNSVLDELMVKELTPLTPKNLHSELLSLGLLGGAAFLHSAPAGIIAAGISPRLNAKAVRTAQTISDKTLPIIKTISKKTLPVLPYTAPKGLSTIYQGINQQ